MRKRPPPCSGPRWRWARWPAGASPEAVTILARYGEAYGIAFQHADDRDDAEHDQHAAAARARLQALVTEACALVSPLGPAGARLVEFRARLDS